MKLNAKELWRDARSHKSAFWPLQWAHLHSRPLTATQDTTKPIWPTKAWQTSTPETQGMDSSDLAGLVDFGTKHILDSLLIAQRGKIVTEAYYAAGKQITCRINQKLSKAGPPLHRGISVD
jgi:hypothetical protein